MRWLSWLSFRTWSIRGMVIGLLTMLLIMAFLAPLLALFVRGLAAESVVFKQLMDTVLWRYVQNSVSLLFGVVLMVGIWGVPSAYLVSRYEFAGRGFFRWALLLPLAIPAYLSAFVYTDVLSYTGVVQKTLRWWFGFSSAREYWFFEIRSMAGAVTVLSLAFAPYVYWLCVVYFTRQSRSLIESAQLSGKSERQIFFSLMLPIARPAIAVGCVIAAMETLADFGTTAYFSIWHLTTAIYDTWANRGDLAAAAKLSCCVLVFVLALIVLEERGRRHLRFISTSEMRYQRLPLQGGKGYLASAWCGLVFGLGFAFPALWLVIAAWRYMVHTKWVAFWAAAGYSVITAFFAALLLSVLAFFLQLMVRINARYRWCVKLCGLGYAVPATVLAVGVLMTTTTLDHRLNALTEALGMGTVGLVFSASLLAIVYAYICRFAVIALGAVDNGFSQLSPSLDHAAYLNGYSVGQTARALWLPLLKPSLLTAFMLVFLESLKELPAAMLLRPFGVQTLATYVFEYMSSEQFELAAVPALLIVLVGLPPIYFLTKTLDRT